MIKKVEIVMCLLIIPMAGSAFAQSTSAVLFRPRIIPQPGSAVISIEAIRAKDSSGKDVVLRRGPVGKGGAPIDRFGGYNTPSSFQWPDGWFAIFKAAAESSSPRAELERKFVELPLNQTWSVELDAATGSVTAKVVNQKDVSFQFDSPAQFQEIAQPSDYLFAALEASSETYTLMDEVEELRSELFGQSEFESVVTCEAFPDECLYIRTTRPDSSTPSSSDVLWLPRNSQPPAQLPEDAQNRDYWTASFAAKAFGRTFEVVLPNTIPADNLGSQQFSQWKYHKFRSMAYFPDRPDKLSGMSRGFRASQGFKLPVQNQLRWQKTLIPDAYWEVRNEYQRKYIADTSVGTVVAQDKPRLIELGREQIGFAGRSHEVTMTSTGKDSKSRMRLGAPSPLRIDSLEAYKDLYYPDVLETESKNNFGLHLRFRRVSDPTNLAPIYVLQNELTVRQLVGLLLFQTFGEDPLWHTKDSRAKYATTLGAAPGSPENPGDLQPGSDNEKRREAEWAKQEYLSILSIVEGVGEVEAQFAAWLFDVKMQQLIDNPPGDNSAWQHDRALFELAQLHPYFTGRWLQHQEMAAAKLGRGQGWDFYVGFVSNAEVQLRGGINNDDRLLRYKLHRGSLQDTGFLIRSDIDALDEPITLISPRTIGTVLPTPLRLPTFAEWDRAAQRFREPAPALRSKPWPASALEEVQGVRDLHGNVSEVIKDDNAYGVVGGCFRRIDVPAHPVPMSERASSAAIGFRLVLQLPEGTISTTPSVFAAAFKSEAIDKLYTEIWGLASPGLQHPWEKEQQQVARFLGNHEYWLNENLRAVMYGVNGYVRDDQLWDQLPDVQLLDVIHAHIFGNN